jgi:hypothetical protein
VTVILANAPYQRCALVQSVAQTVGIELLDLPTDAPNLNLLERFWKFVNKQCLYAKYDPDRESWQHAIMAWIAQAPILQKAALERL